MTSADESDDSFRMKSSLKLVSIASLPPTMSLSTRIRPTLQSSSSSSSSSAALQWARSRSTSATTASIVDAKSRVQERVRSISRAANKRAAAQPNACVQSFLRYTTVLTLQQSTSAVSGISTGHPTERLPAGRDRLTTSPRHVVRRHVRRTDIPRDDAATRREARLRLPWWSHSTSIRRHLQLPAFQLHPPAT